jgi:DNA-binding transcriptional LysR family regulator
MHPLDQRRFDRFCREVLPEIATFSTLYNLRNRSQAGKALGKTGPAVTKAIARLEEALRRELRGGSLIDHEEPQRAEPTDAGELLRTFCETLETESARFLDRLNARQRSSEIRLAITHYAYLSYGPTLEAAYRSRTADGTLNIGDRLYSQDKVWDDIESQVLHGSADVGIYSYPPTRSHEVSSDLSSLDWITEEMVLVVPASRLGASVSFATAIRNLPDYGPVVHYHASLRFDRTETIADFLKNHRLIDQYPEGRWLLGVNNILEIKEHLKRKGGVSFLPWPTVQDEYRDGIFRVFRLKPQMRPRLLKVITRKHNEKPAVTDFMKACASMKGPRRFTPSAS